MRKKQHELLTKLLADLSQFGKNEPGKGTTRLAYSDADNAASNYIIDQMRLSGLTVRTDAAGNIIGRLAGKKEAAGAVACGSHLDTVPQGGQYDGVVGVIAALAAVNNLQAKGPLTHPLEMIVFRSEESSRFRFATLGSKIMAGKAPQDLLNIKDQEGISFAAALEKSGYNPEELSGAIRKNEEFKAFLEVHIEQGRILEEGKLSIGVVENIAAPTRLKVKITGTADHSGATPMHLRKDALTAAAKLVLAVEKIVTKHSLDGTVGTVGMLTVEPGVMNVVPGLVNFGVDIRGVNYENITHVVQRFKDEALRVSKNRNIAIEVELLTSDKPVPLDNKIISLLEKTCQKYSLPYRKMNSGAGHDAMIMAELTPTGMIFIPCQKGISHNPEEYAS
ncbi:MAG: Zn-dependent hydrolase, partial [Sporomusaceae bacterium]|nr:Zn-dependent hydrolase [Sporomusaceae bacterium]